MQGMHDLNTRVINTDKAPTSKGALSRLKQEGNVHQTLSTGRLSTKIT